MSDEVICLVQGANVVQLLPLPPMISASLKYRMVFTSRRYASMVFAVIVSPSICLSVTSRSSMKVVKRRITQTTLYDSQGTLVYCYQRSRQNSKGVTPNGDAK